MKHTHRKTSRILLTLGVSFLAAGCASSSQKRAQENRETQGVTVQALPDTSHGSSGYGGSGIGGAGYDPNIAGGANRSDSGSDSGQAPNPMPPTGIPGGSGIGGSGGFLDHRDTSRSSAPPQSPDSIGRSEFNERG